MIIIILAAGKGNRLKKTLPKSFPYRTKSLIPINNEPAIKRLTKQFLAINQNDILLILGHQYRSVLDVFKNKKQLYVLNKNYERDANLRSLFIGFEKVINEKIFNINEGVLVIEADSFFNNKLLENFLKHINLVDSSKEQIKKICWTTKGNANLNDSGGFIDPFNNISNKKYGDVKNIYIKSHPNNSKTMKMYGITWFNKYAAIDWYFKAKSFLKNKPSDELTGYFHEIIINNINCFSNSYYDLGEKAISFNNFDEYSKCLDLY